ncbi:T9SS type A sorting domain-containing protein [Hymenobacter jejuensis]|uniref:T9SS type A sorting domain-containing protein n=1 Tax=Hymenobacter jejuensis TaxID=2502781 RepID=A0A5B7ZVS0_9BACT|nr:T9SS type A sorting domain-containing protein [Hymenobacter jejuensis]QDA58596.1 T9SS type A sorting domain-containing protein [Hymenobacter jejuensis]
MTSFYKNAWKLGQLPALLAFLFFFGAHQSWGQTPYQLATGTYTENFGDVANWTDNFASGLGANRFGVAPQQTSPALPNQTKVFATGTGGGVQKGTGAIVLLATGASPDGGNAAAFDLYLDFTGVTAGTISLDWAEVNNSSGDRRSTFKLQTNTGDGGAFVDLGGSSVVVTNNVAASGNLTSIALPAGFSNNATAKIRFFLVTSAGGTTGSRPKISLDNVVVTAGSTGTPVPTITTTASAYNSPFCVTSASGSTSFNVAYTSSGTFTGTFRAQLSNASGAFPSNATDNIIGSGSTSPISAIIPAGTPSGTGYRIRVVNDAPATYGADNGTNLTVSQSVTTNPVTVTPPDAQTISLTGTGTNLTAKAASGSTFTWQYSTSASGPFTTAIGGATSAIYQPKGSDFGAAGTYYVVAKSSLSNTCGSATGESSPVTITIPAATKPEIITSVSTLPAFSAVVAGAATSPQSFTVSGTGLSSPLSITPPAGFEIRTGTQPFACCVIQLQPTDGTVNTTTIDVRFAPTAAQAYQATIPVNSSGAADQSVAVSGTSTAPVYPATVSTAELTNITPTSASTGGNIPDDGGSGITARGVVWGKTPNPVLSTLKTSDGTGSGAFTSAITGLTPGTTYYVRAYATTTSAGTAYGQEFTLVTTTVPLAAEPTKNSALTASNVTSTSLLLNLTGGDGTKHLILARLGSAVDAAPVDATTYTPNTAFGQGTQVGVGNYVVYGGTADTVTVRNLRPNTTYTFAVFDYNDNDTPFAENYQTSSPGTLAQATLAVPATMLLEENFAYNSGDFLTNNGWAAHSGGTTNAVAVAAPGLTYAGYGAGSIGNTASITTTGQDVNRQFAAVYARTPVYASFLVKVSSAGTGDYFFHLGPTILSSNFKNRVYVKKGPTTGKVQFGISGNGTNILYTTEEYNLNETYLLVVKYSFDETGTTSRLYINPAVNAEPTTAAVEALETTGTPSDIGTVALRQGGGNTLAPNLLIDGIRVGTTYRVVRTGLTCLAPTPSFTATTVCAGTATAFKDASTTVESNATYAWDVDNDGKVDYTTKGNISHTYAAGTYTATLTITQGACSDTYTQQVTVRALPTATLTGDATVCVGTSTKLTVHLTGVAPWTVGYSINGAAAPAVLTVTAAEVDAEGNYSLTVTPKETTTYALTSLTDGNCTGAALTGSATVTVTTPPSVTALNIPTANTEMGKCGASVAFAATATGSPAPKFVYSIVKDGVTTAITSPYFFPVGVTTVTATATNSCGTDSKTFTVTVQDKEAPTVLTQNLTVTLSKGNFSITAADVNKGSSDACGIASITLSKSTFTCDNIGLNKVTLTVTDIHGNVASQTADVTVKGIIPTPVITPKPSSDVYTGGVATNLYIGYGPQSVTLTASGGVSYSWSGPAGLSKTDIANPIFTATKPGTFLYTVTVTSETGCTATKQVTLKVVDVRCGNKNDKVTICHKGNPSCISSGDIADHLNHGDQLGDCSAAKLTATAAASVVTTEATANVFEAYPNPFTDRAVLHFRSAETGKAQLLIYNAVGKLVATLYNGVAESGHDYEFTVDGATLAEGIYTCRLTTNGKVETKRLVLVK